MHRFDFDSVASAQRMHERGLYASISLGVKAADYDAVARLRALGLTPEYITIDIAHGHADSVQRMIAHLKAQLPGSFVIAGNVSTPEAVIDVEQWGPMPPRSASAPARSALRG